MVKGFCNGIEDGVELKKFISCEFGKSGFSGKVDGIERARACRVFDFVDREMGF